MKKLYETERLVVREWCIDDAPEHFEYCSNEEVNKFMQFPLYRDISESHERIGAMRELYAKGQLQECDWAVCLRETGKAIGSIGINSYSKDGNGRVMIGYIMNPKFQNKGYMTETLKGMFRWVKEQEIAWRIVAVHDVENIASGKVMQKAGMMFEGISRMGTFNNMNERADAAVYSILWEEIL